MEPPIERFYQDIGRELIATVSDDLEGKILLYAEMEDGVGSVSIFGMKAETLDLQLRFAPHELEDLIYNFWKRWKDQPGNSEWRVMCYVIEGAKFHVDLIYPDQIPHSDDDLVPDEYRMVQAKRHFGDVTIHSPGF